MRRSIYEKLLAWKQSSRRKPLVLKGARQVGKTYILKLFAENEYASHVYLNFEENPKLDSVFLAKMDKGRLIQELSLISGVKIEAHKTLIVFDEIQASNRCLNALKFFNENANEYHIVSAGSLLGVKMSRPLSFPVGKVNILEMYPMSFFEFLDALAKEDLRSYIEERPGFEPLSEVIHEELVDLLKKYYLTGGLPEVVQSVVDDGSFRDVRQIQEEILKSYELDFSKHASSRDAPKISLIWHSLPAQLSKENKKFIYGVVAKSARAREYESALQWLVDSGLVYKAHNVSTPSLPIKSYCNVNIFKIYLFDVGLLGAMSGLRPETLLEGDRLFREFKGALTENYVAQELVTEGSSDLFYWSSSGMAEVDFICERGKDVLPLEVKAGVNLKSKSLKVYDEKYSPKILSRTSLKNLKKDQRFCNYPLYAISLF